MKPWLWIPSKLAHDLSPFFISFLSYFFEKQKTPEWNSKQLTTSLYFKNPLGIAGGVDKDGRRILDWQRLGCGFIEIGTVTPERQDANPGKIMDRHVSSKSIWNKMGFPSLGAQAVFEILTENKPQLTIPLFINIGKNRNTSNELAHQDYTFLIQKFANLADAFVINISSPNTQGLRDLTTDTYLKNFLNPIVASRNENALKKPLLVKLSPDMEQGEYIAALKTCLDLNIDGFVLTNTTTAREMTQGYPLTGGVSGAPLREKSIQALKTAKEICSAQKTKKILISVGGVMTAEDVFERIRLGADLVQVYSALIYEGPLFFRKVADVAEYKGQKATS